MPWVWQTPLKGPCSSQAVSAENPNLGDYVDSSASLLFSQDSGVSAMPTLTASGSAPASRDRFDWFPGGGAIIKFIPKSSRNACASSLTDAIRGGS